MSDNLLDVEKVLKDKNPAVLKWMPGFVLGYIKRVLHQDEVNRVLKKNENKFGYDFCVAILNEYNIKVEVEGEENIPKEGGVVFAGNHPFGGLEAMAHVKILLPIRPDIKFVVNDILLSMANIRSLFVGVNKHGATSKESLKNVNKIFGSGNAVLIYPSGMVSRRKNGVISDLEWRKTFITRSKKFNTTIVPVFTSGPPLSSFFYNLSNFRSKIGIKANVEMFYLIDELMKQRNSTFKIIFGKPIPPSTFNKTKTDKQWSIWVREQLYKLEKKVKS